MEEGDMEVDEFARGISWMEEIRFEAFACCTYCRAPLVSCRRWEANDQERFRQRKEGKCQHTGVVKEAFIAIYIRKGDKLKDWMEEECARVELMRRLFGVGYD